MTRIHPHKKARTAFRALLLGLPVNLPGMGEEVRYADGILYVTRTAEYMDGRPSEQVHIGLDMPLGTFIRMASEITDDEALGLGADIVLTEGA